jgi:hypothetical protein
VGNPHPLPLKGEGDLSQKHRFRTGFARPKPVYGISSPPFFEGWGFRLISLHNKKFQTGKFPVPPQLPEGTQA